MICIYKITNKITGQAYIGQSDNIERRWREHKYRTQQYIDKAITNYGEDNFLWEVLEECPYTELMERETYWINYYDTYAPRGYNLNNGSGASRGELHWNAKLTENDIIFIRECYLRKVYPTSKELWEKHYPNITQDTIANVFFGKTWSYIMPEVYTTELKEYYYQNYLEKAIGGRNRHGEDNPMALTNEKDVLKMRIMYQFKERKEIFQLFPKYTSRNIVAIISGQNWKHLPYYKKREKQWVYPSDWTLEQINDFIQFIENYYNERIQNDKYIK